MRLSPLSGPWHPSVGAPEPPGPSIRRDPSTLRTHTVDESRIPLHTPHPTGCQPRDSALCTRYPCRETPLPTLDFLRMGISWGLTPLLSSPDPQVGPPSPPQHYSPWLWTRNSPLCQGHSRPSAPWNPSQSPLVTAFHPSHSQPGPGTPAPSHHPFSIIYPHHVPSSIRGLRSPLA